MIRMTCDDIAAGEISHRYVRGELSEAERSAFEQHYFQCSRCFDALEGSWALQAALARHVTIVRPAIVTRPWRRYGAVAAGLAACISAVLFLQQDTHRTQEPLPVPPAQAPAPQAPAVDLAALARVEPPPYVSLRVRADDDPFEAAMEHYVRRDFGEAARRLRGLARGQPRAANIQFFLGVSELMVDRPDYAIRAFESAAASGTPQVADHAYFLLAKAWLAKGQAPEARRALQACITVGGAHRAAAAELLAKL